MVCIIEVHIYRGRRGMHYGFIELNLERAELDNIMCSRGEVIDRDRKVRGRPSGRD